MVLKFLEAILLQSPVESGPAQSQLAGDAADIPAEPPHRRSNHRSLDILEIQAVYRQFIAPVGGGQQKIIGLQDIAPAHDHCPLDGVLKLADIAGPSACLKLIDRG